MRVWVLLALWALPLPGAQTPAARAAEQAGDLATAERAYEAALKIRPSAETWHRLGLVRHLQNKFEAASLAFREAIRLDPSLWTAHLFLGIGEYRTNRFAAAIASLERADKLAPPKDPGRDEIDYWLGAGLIAAGQPLRGLAMVERLLQREPRHAGALELAARSYANVSTALWNGIAEAHFESAAGLEVHGQALEGEGKKNAAIEAYKQSNAKNPDRPGPGLAAGRLLLQDGKAPEARSILSEELKLPGASPETLYYAGLASVQLSLFEDAADLLRRAALWPERNPEAQLALAQVYLALRQSTQAIEAARAAAAQAPLSEAAHDLLMSAYEMAGQLAEREKERLRWETVRR